MEKKEMVAGVTRTTESKIDSELSQRVRQYLLMKRPELRRIDVESAGGDVRLVGEVHSFYLRQLAIASARRVAGVLRIIDLIEVSGDEP